MTSVITSSVGVEAGRNHVGFVGVHDRIFNESQFVAFTRIGIGRRIVTTARSENECECGEGGE